MIASSRPFRDADTPGDDPPHLAARDRYEEIVPDPVVCTGEYPDSDAPRPVVFGLEPGTGLVLLDPGELEEAGQAAKSAGGSGLLLAALAGSALAAGAAWAARRAQRRGTAAVRESVERARGTGAAPATTVGFG